MFLLNLSLPEFLAIFTALSGVMVALYLLSRSRRRQVVPTMKFWVHATQPVPSSRRRRIQQPWSLLLQLISLALLLLAIAQLHLGTRDTSQRDYVLLLDASSWMGARTGNSKILLDEAKTKARAFVRSLSSADRVMVVRVDSLPSPVTGMETNRETIDRAIAGTRPGASALNLEQAFLFAGQIRRLQKTSGGEIVYVGSRRVSASGAPVVQPAALRVIPVEGPTENIGLTGVGARRSDATPEVWDIFVSVHNYGSSAKRVPVAVQFGGAQIGSALVDVGPNATGSWAFHHRTRAAGWIEARVLMRDALEDDNRAILELPEMKPLKVAVYTHDAESIRPLLAAHPQVQATYLPPSEYRQDVDAQVVIADGFAPAPEPKVATVFIEPPDGSPFRTRTQFSAPKVVRWRSEHEITAGIRTRDQRLPAGRILSPARTDISLGDVDGGPAALVRPERRYVALGFHPGKTDLRFDLTTPLLLANILRWMQPDAFRTPEVHGSSVGTVIAAVDNPEGGKVRVLSDGQELPYTVQGKDIRFYSGTPGVVRVLTGEREQVYSMSLPEVGEREWTVPEAVRRGVPGGLAQAFSRDLWRVLAIAGTLGLLAEWLIFGRRRILGPAVPNQSAAPGENAWRKAS